MLRPEARLPIGQLLHPVLHADGELPSADGAERPLRFRLKGREADAAGSVAVVVVFALFGEKLNGAKKALAGLDGSGQALIGEPALQEVGLPAQPSGGVGVRVGDKGVPVQSGEPPVHGRIGGKAGFQGVNIGRKIPEAFLKGVKPGEGAEEGKVRRPDVGGDKDSVRAGLQGDLQKIPAVQAQNGPPVGVEIPDGLQLVGELFSRLQGGKEDQAVNLAGSAVLFIDGADLSGKDKAGAFPGSPPGKLKLRTQAIEAVPLGEQALSQLLPPGGMGEIPGAQQPDPLFAPPKLQPLGHAFPAGCPGVSGMNVQICDIHKLLRPFGGTTRPAPFPDSPSPWNFRDLQNPAKGSSNSRNLYAGSVSAKGSPAWW